MLYIEGQTPRMQQHPGAHFAAEKGIGNYFCDKINKIATNYSTNPQIQQV